MTVGLPLTKWDKNARGSTLSLPHTTACDSDARRKPLPLEYAPVSGVLLQSHGMCGLRRGQGCTNTIQWVVEGIGGWGDGRAGAVQGTGIKNKAGRRKGKKCNAFLPGTAIGCPMGTVPDW